MGIHGPSLVFVLYEAVCWFQFIWSFAGIKDEKKMRGERICVFMRKWTDWRL